MYDSMYDDTGVSVTLPPAARSAAGAVNGTAVDLGQGGDFNRAVLFAVVCGAITDATHTITFQGSDDGTTGWTPLAAENVQGAVPVLGPANSGLVYRVAWDGGNRRFVRAVTTVGGTPTTGGIYTVLVIKRGRTTPRGLPS